MQNKSLFQEHIRHKEKQAWELLEELSLDSIVIDAGIEGYYYDDDQTVPYRTSPEFRSWCPEPAAGSVIQVEPGKKAKLISIQFDDFWHAPPVSGEWVEAFDSCVVNSRDQALALLPKAGKNLWIGPGLEFKEAEHWEWNSSSAIAALNWNRAQKTSYEQECLRAANKLGAAGHDAARSCFLNGGSEWQIYMEYLKAIEATEAELPYSAIIGLDQNAGVLHYQHKSRQLKESKVLLVDAGANVQCYGSDITRTWVRPGVHSVFKELLDGLDRLQLGLIDDIKVNTNFADLHLRSVDGIGELLLQQDVIRGVEVGTPDFRNVVRAFFPHGLGHMLGVLVHDVGGRQKNRKGDACEPHKEDPKLRTNRALREDEVVTIEPGIYWIPMLLKTVDSQFLNSSLIDELIPLGGMRIEDNVVVRSQKADNLTRPYLA